MILNQFHVAIETALDCLHKDYIKPEYAIVVRGSQMKSVVIAVVGEHRDPEREVNKALLAVLIDYRKAVSTEFQVHICALLRMRDLIA
jgi:hypothetical protein